MKKGFNNTNANKKGKPHPKHIRKVAPNAPIARQVRDKGKGVREETKSMELAFKNAARAGRRDHFASRLTSINGSPAEWNTFDACAYVALCQTHNKMAISKEESSGYVWLPFVSLPPHSSWAEGATNGANIVLSGGDANTYVKLRSESVISESHCMQMFRLQLPQTQVFQIRLIYFVRIDAKNNPEYKCCSDTKRLIWIPIDDINVGKVAKLWGPEVIEFARLVSRQIFRVRIEEYSLNKAFYYVPRDPPRNLEEEMLKSTNFTEKDVERLYADFVEHCFPSFFMTQTSFSDYMSKYGFEKMDKKLRQLFKAFNFHKNSFLGFHEFLLGLTSIDPMAQNGQSRIKFVFKYFDVDSDGSLNENEFTSMVREIYPKDSGSEVKRKTKESMKMIGIKRNGVRFDDFFAAVGAHKFRGTSDLCRSNRPIVSKIVGSMASRSLKGSTGKADLRSILMNRKYKGVCESCREKRYEYAIHLVRLNSEGWCMGAKVMPERGQIEKSVNTNKKAKKTESTGSTDITALSRNHFSTEFKWNPKSVANYLIEQIRAFDLKKGSHNDNRGLMDGPEEREAFVEKLEELCTEVGKIVAEEDRCAKVSSPAFIIGDIHGNLEDLFTLERVLWKSIPIVTSNLLFLGDYVDRGKWGLECAIYLMCLKLLAPNKVVLLRGNHEVRELQTHYTYKAECYHKYGDTLGPKVYEITNRVFDRLPFCAVVDDAIYCAHGGIPCSTALIDQINEVKSDMKDPEKEAAIAWEILWSDPIDAQQFLETAQLLQVRPETSKGFLMNNKRGTAFLFGEEAVNYFLQKNGMTHMVRAHEVPAQGYTFHFGNKCTTVFSSSHYCGNNNESAVIHVDSEKLRIVCLDTVNNAPACD